MYIGKKPTPAPLTSSDITDGIVSIADLATTGTASSSTFLRGDGAFAEAGGLVDTKFVTFQGTQSHTGNSFADVTDLTITHTCSNSSNKIILMAHIGSLQTLGSSSNTLSGSSAFAFSVDGSRPASMMGTPASSRVGVVSRDGARGVNQDHGSGGIFLQGVHSPGDTSSHTYKVQVLCQSGEYALIGKAYNDNDSNNSYGSRASSTLQLLEVSV